MNFSDKTFEALAPFERHFRTACDSDWCQNPGRSALDLMARSLEEIDHRPTVINHACGSCILRVVKRVGYLYFADKAERETQSPAEAKCEAAAAPEAPKPKKAPAKKTTATTAKKTAKK